MREVCHGIDPVPQPKPHLNPGGDCFACSTAAAVGWCCPEKGTPSIETVHEWFTREDRSGTPNLVNTWNSFRWAFGRAKEAGYLIESRAWVLAPQWRPDQFSHGHFHFEPEMDYVQHVEGFLSAGWVGIASIRFDGSGLYTPDFGIKPCDHNVVIDGARQVWRPFEDSSVKGASLRCELRGVCSVKGAYWMRAQDLFRRHGLAALWLVRRDEC